MFFNKTKAVWKQAFKIRKEDRAIFRHKRMIKKTQQAIEKFKSEDHCKKYAYMLAEANTFQGSPEFYWKTAKKILDVICTGLEAEIQDSEQCILRLRWCYRFNRDYK